MKENQKNYQKTAFSNPKKNQKKKSSRIVILVMILLLIGLGTKIFLDYQHTTALKKEVGEKDIALEENLKKLQKMQIELENKIEEISMLGGSVEELYTAKEEIEEELRRTKKRSSREISLLKGRVRGFQELLTQKDEEIAKLKEMNEQLFSENSTLKTEKNELSSTLKSVNDTNEKLETKVAIASRLKAKNIAIYGVSARGKEKEMPRKSKQIEKLKVVFNIAENNVAPIEGKNIFIRIVNNSNNKVIFDVKKGSGTFMYNNKDLFYTASQNILFDNSSQQLSFEYNKGSQYDVGNYTLEIYCDNYLMGSKKFEVK